MPAPLVYVLDTDAGRTVTWRSGERFAFASTIKAPLAGAVLNHDNALVAVDALGLSGAARPE